MEQQCKYCSYPVSENFNFCPNCGKMLKEPPITLMKQLGVYALSVFLPPLGLWPGIRYLMQKDDKAKIVGLIAIVLTIASSAITIYWSMGLLNGLIGQNAAMTNQLQQLQNTGPGL